MVLGIYNGKKQQEKINVVIEEMMSEAGWQQKFGLEFIRLAFGYAAVAVSLVVYYLEKTYLFKDVRFITGLLCCVYFSFTWGAWLWQRTVEHSAFYNGEKSGTTVWVASEYPKHAELVKITTTVKVGTKNEVKQWDMPFETLLDTHSLVHKSEIEPMVQYLDHFAQQKQQ